MDIDNELYSPYIESGIIKKDKYRIFGLLVKFFFNRIELDEESILIVNEHMAKGKIVYASMQTTYTSLYILINLLDKHNLPVPTLGLGFIPYSYQKIIIIYHEILTYFKKLFKPGENKFISNHEYIARTLDQGSLSFSMLSRKLFVRRYVQIKTDAIEYLLEIQKKSDVPVFIFPQVIFWNRNPEKSGSILNSEAVGDRGLLSGMMTMWKSATPAFLRIGKPVNLKEMLEAHNGGDVKHLSRQIRNNLMEIYNYEKRSVLGPQIKSQQEMMEKVLYHKNVLDVIQQEINEKRIPEKKLRRKAYGYFREIAADFSIVYIRFFKATNDYLFRKIFDGIHFDIEDFKKIREASSKGPVILVPSHKSHMDYIIISSMFYHNKLIPPHILAGSNLTFFPMGKIFRRSGAFFMRRTFKGLNLYASVFKQYVKSLINEGYTIEFFIEGTRSRTGKVVKPKMGMLKYLIEAIDEGYNKDLVFAPLTVNYDRILEENSYLKELKGKEKTTESTSGFIKSRKLIQRKYGSVYMGFNEPFTLSEVREKFLKEKNVSDIDDFTEELGYYIVKKINDTVIVTPFAITTAALLNTTARGFTRESVKRRIMIILSYLKKTNYKMVDSLKDNFNIDDIMDLVFESYAGDGIISRADTSGEPNNSEIQNEELYIIDHDQRGRINFYKNSMTHMTLPVNMISLAILITSANGKTSRSKVSAEFERIRDALSREFVYPDLLNDTEAVLENTLSHLSSEDIIKGEGKEIIFDESGDEVLKFFAGMIQDYIESYLIVLNTISDYPEQLVSRKDLTIAVRKRGTRMYHLSEIQCSEALSMINYNNALDKFIDAGILQQLGESRKAQITISNRERAAALKSMIAGYLDKVRSN
ncbi:MAG TPA: 1-acyl-sn-glycerol-3-phosphate acyltransferase [Spirochaetota bacterium]|nr:1-acyl-sn-glycerol-3-phosphate acyltransferase [Spirochaetota bacterium]